jgi:predicted O-methyltransferase YrrM
MAETILASTTLASRLKCYDPGNTGMEMMDERALAVLRALEVQDAREREAGTPRGERLRQVTPEVGRFLHTLVLAARPGSLLEIGTSGAYSTIWLAAAAREIGAVVTTLEIDPKKVAVARENLAAAGLAKSATIIEGDALRYLRSRQGPLHFVFLDAEKKDYETYLSLLVPLLPIGGVLVADNLLSHGEELAGFAGSALGDERLYGLVVPIGRGELLAVRVA